MRNQRDFSRLDARGEILCAAVFFYDSTEFHNVYAVAGWNTCGRQSSLTT